MPAQPGEGGAHRGLRHPHAHPGPGDAALLDQCLQDDQEVQVDATEGHETIPAYSGHYQRADKIILCSVMQ